MVIRKLINFFYLLLRDLNLLRKTDSDYFNRGFKFSLCNNYFVNERVVEKPYVTRRILELDNDSLVLDFGCVESSLAIELASLGYKVTGVDFRQYSFDHPNLKFIQGNLLNVDAEVKFDFVVALSVIEHIGLGAYGEESRVKDFNAVLKKFSEITKSGGKLFISVPVGKPIRDNFLRSFSPQEARSLMQKHDFTLSEEKYFLRHEFKYWFPSTGEEVEIISNAAEDRGLTGVNAVGCFIWQKE